MEIFILFESWPAKNIKVELLDQNIKRNLARKTVIVKFGLQI